MAFSYSTGFVHKIFNNTANGGLGFAEIFKDGVIEVYAGTRPVNADAAVSGTLLGTVTVNGGAFVAGQAANGLEWGTAADRAIDKASAETWQFTAGASGTATWFRIKGNATDAGSSSTSLPRIDGTISAFGGDATLSDTNIVSGNVYTLNRCKFTWPA
jgi:hypothetical protein